ncbi:MAG: HAMP domain-containing protein [Rhodocyclaceae bacterium]|nr:HAMP domain-containing protein [Rhodocyclaceae bacterium]
MPNNHPRPRWLPPTVDARLLAGFALIALLPTLLAGLVGIRLVRTTMADEAIDHAAGQLTVAAGALARELEHHAMALRAAADGSGLQAMLSTARADDPATADRVAEELGDLLRGQPHWQRLRLVDRDGRVLLQADRGAPHIGGFVATAVAAGEMEGLRAVHDSAAGQVYVSPLQDDADDVAHLALGAAVRDGSGRSIAALLVEVPRTALTDRLPPLSSLQAARWHLLDRSGRILRWQYEAGSKVEAQLLPAVQVGDTLPRAIADRVMRGDSGHLTDGRRTVLFAGIAPKLAMVSSASSPLRWSLAASAPSDRLGADAVPTRLWFVALALMLLLMTAAGLAFARRLLQPWRILQQQAAEIADGHFEQRVECGRRSALAPVADSINRLAERLQEARENKEALERRASQQQSVAARQGQERAIALERAMAGLPLGVILADRQGRVLLATPRAAELLGVAPDSLRESWLPALLPPLETALDRGEAMQCSLHRPQGTLELGVQPVATATDGQPNLVVTLAKLAKAGDDRPPVAVPPELVRELAAATADSLSRPLGGMSLMAQTLLRDATLPPGPRKHLVRLADELEKIARRLQPLSERTAAIAPENRPLDAAAAIDRALAEWTAYAKVRDLQIDRSGLADDIRIAADPQHFARLLHHLIANAFDAMPDGGTLTLTSQPRADRLEIVLEDRGEGIAEAALPTLFDAFQGSRGDHAGLGLASVRRILAAQGAEISVASAVGQGTRIRVSWPLADD